MINTCILAALLAEAAGGHSKPESGNHPIVVSVPTGTMTCTKQGDRLICVLPLRETPAGEPQLSAAPPPRVPYKRTPPTPALPDPQLLGQLKVAERNIALAKSLLPRAATPEAAVLAQQLLYWANQQYKWAQALLPANQEDPHHASDPFDPVKHESSAPSM